MRLSAVLLVVLVIAAVILSDVDCYAKKRRNKGARAGKAVRNRGSGGRGRAGHTHNNNRQGRRNGGGRGYPNKKHYVQPQGK